MEESAKLTINKLSSVRVYQNKSMENNKSENLLPVVEKILENKKLFLDLSNNHNTPFYVYDQESLDENICRFVTSFERYIPKFEPYYAMKINHHPFIVDHAVKEGMGLDVASIRELKIALKAGAKKIVYYSPAKSKKDLRFALKHSDEVRIHMDSFNELELLGKLTDELKTIVGAGIRINLPSYKSWTKYGIPLDKLKKFWDRAKDYNFLKLNGIHFHQSRNKNSSFYTNTIQELSKHLSKKFSPDELKSIEYVDFGGGFEPYKSEGVIKNKKEEWPKYKINKAVTIEKYAKKIGGAIKKYLDPLIEATYISEPGRYICNDAMHIVLSVADIKKNKNCILDGGVNMVGWQRFEKEYFPLINITHPSKKEHQHKMWGNLCTTWDIWGYYYYGSKLKKGDIIIVPCQGALTYSLAQSFINNIPKVYKLT